MTATDTPITVIGGGLAGLVAAITAADAGAPVVLHEAGPQLGGRAASGDGPYGVNLGPHVIYEGGAVTAFLRQRRLHRELRLRPTTTRGVRFVDERGAHLGANTIAPFVAMHLKREAPADVDFATWATESFGRRIGTTLRHLSGLYTFHHDPGSLAADFVWRGCRHSMGRPDKVRYIGGGWSSLIATLEAAARARGVRIELDSPVDELPSGPTIVALPLRAAGVLLDDEVNWPMARTALLDVAVDGAPDLRSLIFDMSSDLGGCILAERFTWVDPGLAPPGVDLIQAHLGVAEDASLDDAVARMERSIDALGDWRPHEVWRRSLIVERGSSAADPVGTTWRDRPAIDRGDARYLAGDATAAPGLLSEVSVNSAVRAAGLAVAGRRQRQWAPGWPTTELSTVMRSRVLASVLPGSSVDTDHVAAPIDEAWKVEPVAEAEPYRTRTKRWGTTRLTSAEPAPDGGAILTTVTVPRRG